jgi:microcin C transport system permease protein
VPAVVNYPEDKFGGFLATTDFRDPFIQDEVNGHGWMLWPPIRYSYGTVNNEIPTPAPAAPWWMMTLEQRCAHYPNTVNDPNCTIGNWNWLGAGGSISASSVSSRYGRRSRRSTCCSSSRR